MSEYLLGSCTTPNKAAVYCWNYNTGNVEHMYRSKFKSFHNNLCILCNDYILIAENDKPLVDVWPVNSQEPKFRFILPGKPEALCVDNSGTYLVAGISIRVYIWLITSGDLLNVLEKNYQPITCIKVCNNSEFLVVASVDGSLSTYNLNEVISRSLIGKYDPLYTKTDHIDTITDLAVGAFNNKSRVVSISLDKTCRVYNLCNGDVLKVLIFNNNLSRVILDGLSWFIYIGDCVGTVSVVKLEQTSLTEHTDDKDCFKGHTNMIVSMDINLNHNTLATASADGSIIIWDLKTRKQLRMIKQEFRPTCLRFFGAHTNINSKMLKPRIVLQPLKKSILTNLEDFECSKFQLDDVGFTDRVKTEVRTVNNMNQDDLRIVNNQLYDLFVMTNWENYGNNER